MFGVFSSRFFNTHTTVESSTRDTYRPSWGPWKSLWPLKENKAKNVTNLSLESNSNFYGHFEKIQGGVKTISPFSPLAPAGPGPPCDGDQ